MKGHKPHSLEYLPVFICSENYFLHYTCNPPSDEVLTKNKIGQRGEDFGCVNPNEVLKIPLETYHKKGFSEVSNKEIVTLNLEKLLRDLK
jgi:hypothetical protein